MQTKLNCWEKIESVHLADYKIFSIHRVRSRSPRTGKILPFHIVECGTWINVFPVTESGHVVMIRQYRQGTEEITLEIPGGLVEAGEEPLHAARREMIEETGYDSETIIPLGSVTPNPAFITNRCHIFLAPHASLVTGQSLDQGEDIEVVLTPIDQLPQLVAEGAIHHALVVAAVYYLQNHTKKHPEWMTQTDVHS
ncbi:MAG: NUDIX hydrolase [bacterium]